MREIKFRAWDTEGENMLTEFVMNSKAQILQLAGFGNSDIVAIDGAYILMQFTGLKDKNGKEVYEGDIVRATANGNRKYQIVWNSLGLGHWWIVDIKRDNYSPNKIPIHLNAIELIGNIYENPGKVQSSLTVVPSWSIILQLWYGGEQCLVLKRYSIDYKSWHLVGVGK